MARAIDPRKMALDHFYLRFQRRVCPLPARIIPLICRGGGKIIARRIRSKTHWVSRRAYCGHPARVGVATFPLAVAGRAGQISGRCVVGIDGFYRLGFGFSAEIHARDFYFYVGDFVWRGIFETLSCAVVGRFSRVNRWAFDFGCQFFLAEFNCLQLRRRGGDNWRMGVV
jgi:hypothetical protein